MGRIAGRSILGVCALLALGGCGETNETAENTGGASSDSSAADDKSEATGGGESTSNDSPSPAASSVAEGGVNADASSESLEPCPLGEEPGSSGECTPCTDGTFRENTSSESCKPFRDCEPGTYVSGEPAADRDRRCTECPVGFESTETNAVECTALPPRIEAVQLSAGNLHNCAVLPDGAVACWGNGEEGQLEAPADVKFVQVAAGGYHTCGLRSDNSEVECWGLNDQGQTTAPSGTKFLSIEAGTNHTCGVTEDSGAVCWGANEEGQLDVPEGLSFSEVGAGENHSCGLTLDDGTPVCWGKTGGLIDVPSGLVALHGLSVAREETCALSSNGSRLCWGTDTLSITDIRCEQLSCGRQHGCCILSEEDWDKRPVGSIRCWGYADGDRTTAPDGVTFSNVAAGGMHTCGIREDNGRVECWGRDDDGQTWPPEG